MAKMIVDKTPISVVKICNQDFRLFVHDCGWKVAA